MFPALFPRPKSSTCLTRSSSSVSSGIDHLLMNLQSLIASSGVYLLLSLSTCSSCHT